MIFSWCRTGNKLYIFEFFSSFHHISLKKKLLSVLKGEITYAHSFPHVHIFSGAENIFFCALLFSGCTADSSLTDIQ
ncbi:MAG: hypothetical protein D3904_08810 [Candidatus Electrothrix sp. EH2]|nr:hypothetical protein [Candidatus Electrothrix sp. EH2]